MFVVSTSFQVEVFGSLRYRVISSANRDTLTVSLLIYIPFISSSCLIALAMNSRTRLNSSGDSGHPCLVPDFRGNGFSFSPLSMRLAEGLSYIALTMLRYFLSILSINACDQIECKELFLFSYICCGLLCALRYDQF
jgi:hypothetical protein